MFFGVISETTTDAAQMVRIHFLRVIIYVKAICPSGSGSTHSNINICGSHHSNCNHSIVCSMDVLLKPIIVSSYLFFFERIPSKCLKTQFFVSLLCDY